MEKIPALGFGLGLRATHYPYIFEHTPPVDFFEIISENFMDTQGRPIRNLEKIRAHYPVVMHGVSMSIGTLDPMSSVYLKKLKDLVSWLNPPWITDHVCWTGIAHTNTHDLLPLPYTPQALAHLVDRINRVQDALGRPMGFENPSTYLEFGASTMDEAEFLAQMVDRSGCQLLLDVNNVYVSCYNHRWDVKTYLDTLPLDRVVQIHLAGHANKGTHIIDTHDGPVIDPVWTMYQYVVEKAGRTPNTMIEWDDKIPEFPVLFAELEKARQAARTAAHHGPLPDLKQAKDVTPFDTQTDFGGVLTRMQDAILAGSKGPSTAHTWIRTKADFAPDVQLRVYINAYRWRLKDVVAQDYDVLATCLGAQVFTELLNDFVETEVSTNFNIGRFAAKLPDFLKKKYPQDPFAYELCILENAIAQLADEPETSPLETRHLEGVTPENLMQMRLFPRKSLALFDFSYDVNAYFGAFVEKRPLPVPEKKQTYLAVYRHDAEMWRHS
ncbi:MAG: DUF692 domain-containing protein, partial [Proteobacteria bacterium]|nr:DUF692 domain-containing protein [Pseudomonadota bacterium]